MIITFYPHATTQLVLACDLQALRPFFSTCWPRSSRSWPCCTCSVRHSAEWPRRGGLLRTLQVAGAAQHQPQQHLKVTVGT
jgi:hypothetical protein